MYRIDGINQILPQVSTFQSKVAHKIVGKTVRISQLDQRLEARRYAALHDNDRNDKVYFLVTNVDQPDVTIVNDVSDATTIAIHTPVHMIQIPRKGFVTVHDANFRVGQFPVCSKAIAQEIHEHQTTEFKLDTIDRLNQHQELNVYTGVTWDARSITYANMTDFPLRLHVLVPVRSQRFNQ